jgi:predicted DNA-binding transcriptional regulator YafY
MIRSAIREKKNLEILYLKAKDEKSRRTIRPVSVGEMEYNGHPFVGMNAWCLIRKEKRVFNVDRILEIGWPEES